MATEIRMFYFQYQLVIIINMRQSHGPSVLVLQIALPTNSFAEKFSHIVLAK